MKAKAILCAAVLASLVAVGCSKAEKETGRRVAAEESRAPRTDNLYDHLGLGRLRKVTVTRGPTMDLRPEDVVVRSTGDAAFLSRLQQVLTLLPKSTGVYADIGRNTRTYRIELEGTAKSATLTLFDRALALPKGDVADADALTALLEDLFATSDDAGAVAWAEAVNGLRIGLQADRWRVEVAEPIMLTVRAENVSGHAMTFLLPDFCESRTRFWRVRPAKGLKRLLPYGHGSLRKENYRLLQPGETWCAQVNLSGVWAFKPDTYTICGQHAGSNWYRKADGSMVEMENCWTGTVTTGAVEIEITAKGGAAAE